MLSWAKSRAQNCNLERCVLLTNSSRFSSTIVVKQLWQVKTICLSYLLSLLPFSSSLFWIQREGGYSFSAKLVSSKIGYKERTYIIVWACHCKLKNSQTNHHLTIKHSTKNKEKWLTYNAWICLHQVFLGGKIKDYLFKSTGKNLMKRVNRS